MTRDQIDDAIAARLNEIFPELEQDIKMPQDKFDELFGEHIDLMTAGKLSIIVVKRDAPKH